MATKTMKKNVKKVKFTVDVDGEIKKKKKATPEEEYSLDKMPKPKKGNKGKSGKSSMDDEDQRKKDKKKRERDHKEAKLSESRDVALVGGSALAGLDSKKKKSNGGMLKLDGKAMKSAKSFFGTRSSAIMTLLEQGNNDNAISMTKKSLLQTLVRVLPEAEKILLATGTQRGVYQFNTLVSSVRELIADIEADRDRDFIAQALIVNVVQPAFINMAQQMMLKHHEFRKRSEDYVLPESKQIFSNLLFELGKEIASDMQGSFKELKTKIEEALKN